ncbi:MAG: PH domain-containing protein [Rhodoglobus sp.]
MRFAPTIFRPAFGRVLSVIVVLIAGAGLAGFIVGGNAIDLLRYAWGPLLLAAVALALFWFPSLAVAEHQVTIRNVFSTVHVPWSAITLVDTKWALTLHTAQLKVVAWAAPAPNRYASQAATRASARVASSNFAPRPGDLLESQSGAAAFVIRHHWEDLRSDGLLDAGVEPGSVRRDIHWVTIAVLATLTVATALGILL